MIMMMNLIKKINKKIIMNKKNLMMIIIKMIIIKMIIMKMIIMKMITNPHNKINNIIKIKKKLMNKIFKIKNNIHLMMRMKNNDCKYIYIF